MLGTRVGVFLSRGRTLWRRVRADGSFASSNDPRLLFGLGDEPRVLKVRAHWIGGEVEDWSDFPIDPYASLYQGSGRAMTRK